MQTFVKSDEAINKNEGLIRLKEVLKLIPVSRATWWNGCRTGKFPKAYKISPNITVWKKAEIIQLIDGLKV